MAVGFSTSAARQSDFSDKSSFSSVFRVHADRPQNITMNYGTYGRRNSDTSNSTSYDRWEITSLALMMVLLITLSFLFLPLAPWGLTDVHEIHPQKLSSILFPSSSVRKLIQSQFNPCSHNSSKVDPVQEKKGPQYYVAEAFNNEYLQNDAVHVEPLIHQEITQEENISHHERTYTEGIREESSQALENVSRHEKTPPNDPISSVSHFFKLKSAKQGGGANITKKDSIALRSLFEADDEKIYLQEEREQNNDIVRDPIIYMQNKREQTSKMVNEQTIMKKKREQIKNVIATLRKAGMFAMVATRIEAMDLLSLPQMTTIFVPTDSAFDIFMNASNAYISDHLLHYHIVVPRYTFEDLCGLKKGDKLTAYLMGCKITVTENELFNYTLDDVRIISPDLYVDDSVVVHGINGVLNYTKFCNINDTSSAPSPEMSGSSTSSNNTKPVSNLPTNPLLQNSNGSTSLPSVAASPMSFNGVYSKGFTHTSHSQAIKSMGFAGILHVSYIFLSC